MIKKHTQKQLLEGYEEFRSYFKNDGADCLFSFDDWKRLMGHDINDEAKIPNEIISPPDQSGLSTVFPEIQDDGLFKVIIPSQLDEQGRKPCGCMSENPSNREPSVQFFEDLPAIQYWTCTTCGKFTGGFAVDLNFYINRTA